jgi:hypothetical protein
MLDPSCQGSVGRLSFIFALLKLWKDLVAKKVSQDTIFLLEFSRNEILS